MISADRNPNTRGALVTGLISELPTTELSQLAADIDAGKVTTLLSVGEDLTAAGLSDEQLAKVNLVYVGSHSNATSAAATVIIPTLTVFEKSGTFINQQFRIQKFKSAVPGLKGAADDRVVLASLLEKLGDEAKGSDLASVWAEIAETVPALSGISYANVPKSGLLIDGSAWSGLDFPEGESLHFKPATAEASA